MSGHSKWNTIKRQKAATDAKRSAAFTKFANAIAVAAKKGTDPDSNFSLRIAIDKARKVNMPKDSIEKSIKKGNGSNNEAIIEELIYEGIGPLNIQFIIKCLTDNKNRTAAEIRHTFTKFGGSLGTVSWNFRQLGVIIIEKSAIIGKKWDDIELELIDKDVEDIIKENNEIIIYCKIEDLQNIKKMLDSLDIDTQSSEIEFIPKEKIKIKKEDEDKIEKFINILEDNEDIADYYSNIEG